MWYILRRSVSSRLKEQTTPMSSNLAKVAHNTSIYLTSNPLHVKMLKTTVGYPGTILNLYNTSFSFMY